MSTNSTTIKQYDEVIDRCQQLFLNKTKDYGTSWRVLRSISIVDQIYIKAWRIRQIQQLQTQKIGDSIESEFIGIVNYALIALIQHSLDDSTPIALAYDQAKDAYNNSASEVKKLMLNKNHDYGEAWRNLSQESFVDLILVKLLRIRQIIANEGIVTVSEGADANFADIINYGVFALIKIDEAKQI